MFVCRFIGEEGLKKISENGTVTDVKELVKRALDVSVYGFFFLLSSSFLGQSADVWHSPCH